MSVNQGICTAAFTTIYHNSQTETFANVWFHSEDSFLNEVIKPYYERLQLGASPETLEAFANNRLSALPPIYRDASQLTLYEELCRYHRNFDQYKDLLNTASPRRVQQQQIRDFTTQDIANNDHTSFNHLAVKEVEVLSPFSNSNATSLAFIDTPGMGGMNIGKEEKLLKALQDDVDVVLFVRRPSPTGDVWQMQDIELYDIVNQVMPSPLATRSFMILNRTKGNIDNISICEDFASNVARKHMSFVDCIIADCADHAEVDQKILDALINFLSQNIAEMDKQFMLSYQNKLNELQEHIASILTEAKLALNDSDSPFYLSSDLFHSFWQRLTTSLQEFLHERKHGNHLNNYAGIFQASINELFYDIRNNFVVPSLGTVEQDISIEGSYTIASAKLLVQIRAELSRRFLGLDKALKKISEDMKSDIAEVLIEQINLFNLPDMKGVEFLQQLIELLPQDAENLKLGIQNLSNFSITYPIFLQPRVRECLNRFNPDNNIAFIQAKDAREVHNALETIYREALDDCEQALINTSQELNQLFCAVVEEFIDRVIRAEGVREEWSSFLHQNRNAILRSFELPADYFEAVENWQKLIANIEIVNAEIAKSF